MNLIVGFGEIGRGLYANLREEPIIYDPEKKYYGPSSDAVIEFMHICIPGNLPDFHTTVCNLIRQFNPAGTIIHSTVVPGTTKKIHEETGVSVVHCPIRGKHPNMADHIKVYELHLGGPDFVLYQNYFDEYGLESCGHWTSEETELGKILELYRYGKEIQDATEQKELCDLYGLAYSDVVTPFIETYNEGLEKVGMPQYKQPFVTPMEGNHLGGHCVIENCWELYKQLRAAQYPMPNGLRSICNLISFGKGTRELK